MASGRTKLAFPAWAMGQVLLPEQFQVQQDVILAQIASRAAVAGLPAWGLGRLVIDERQLEHGALTITGLSYVFGSGLLIEYPGNATLSNLSLDGVGVGKPAEVYLHIRNRMTDASELDIYEDDPRTVTRQVFQAVLSLKAQLDDCGPSVKLIQLGTDDGRWVLDDYAPPLLQVGCGYSRLLTGVLERCEAAVHTLASQLARRIERAILNRKQLDADHGDAKAADIDLSRENLSDLRRERAATVRVLAQLAELGIGRERSGEIALHPYELFRCLRDLYLEVADPTQQESALDSLIYEHDGLARCFTALVTALDGLLGRFESQAARQSRLEFQEIEGWYVAGPFPDELHRATEVFLVVGHDSGKAASLDGVKLASVRRFDEITHHMLPGVPLAPVGPTLEGAFIPTYGRDASFYELDVTHPEWASAVEEGNLCFAGGPDFDGVHAELTWGV